MILERSFNIPIDEATARSRVAAYLTLSGYAPIGGTGSLLFRRGSVMGSLSSFNPASWKCEAAIYIKSGSNPLEVKVAYSVGNDPLEESITRALWTDEFNRLQKAVANNDFTPADVKSIKRKVAGNVLSVIGMLAGLLLSAVAALYLGMFLFSHTGLAGNLDLVIGLACFIVLALIVIVLWNRFRTKY